MIYDVGLTAALHLSCRPPSVANQSQNTQHFLPGLTVDPMWYRSLTVVTASNLFD